MKEFDIEERVKIAVQNFESGYNCAQSVFLAYSDVFELNLEMAKKMSVSFGGGVGRMREVCGTVSAKLTEFATPADKLAKMQEIKTGLEALIDKIDVLRLIRVDFNINPEETWDVILTTELDSLEDVKTYANHPEHVAVSKGIIGPVKADRACVDYEF